MAAGQLNLSRDSLDSAVVSRWWCRLALVSDQELVELPAKMSELCGNGVELQPKLVKVLVKKNDAEGEEREREGGGGDG